MKLLLASQNKGKMREFKEILTEVEIVTLADIDLDIDVEENGQTFEENALIKAKTIAEMTGMVTIADDSGLCVDALDGAPGIYSARFGGEHGNDDENIKKLLSLLQDKDDRTARFVSAVVVYFPDGKTLTARGECVGKILTEKHGNGGFGYDPVFYTEVFGKSFGELTAEEKNSISHRSNALKKMKKLLEEVKNA